MGLKLRYNLYHGVTGGAVCGALKSFYATRGRPLKSSGPDSQRIDVHEAENNWVVVALDSGWEWKERREAQLFVSRRLWCPGFLIFVYDGDYWGYEFFNRGEVLDHFVQQRDEAERWFPGSDCSGQPHLLVDHLPFLDIEVVAPYLKQRPSYGVPPGLEGRVRPTDQFERFDECAVMDFLRALDAKVRLVDDYVRVDSPTSCSLWKT
jgi:hypothetical protein